MQKNLIKAENIEKRICKKKLKIYEINILNES